MFVEKILKKVISIISTEKSFMCVATNVSPNWISKTGPFSHGQGLPDIFKVQTDGILAR